MFRYLRIISVKIKIFLGRIVRLMWQERRIPDKERVTIRVAIDEIINWLHGFPANLQSPVSVAVGGDLAVRQLAVATKLLLGHWAKDRHAFREASIAVMAFPEFSGLQAFVTLLG